MRSGETLRTPSDFIPGLGFHVLTPIYDLVQRATMGGKPFPDWLVSEAEIGPGHRVLEVGCGTGRLSEAVLRARPDARLLAIDIDPAMLARTSRRLARATGCVQLIQGRATHLPVPDRSIDRVVTCLVLHHLETDAKSTFLNEARRVLRPGGRLHVADWGGAKNLLQEILFLPVRLLDGFGPTGANIRGELPAMLEAAGFLGVRETRRLSTLFGILSFYRGQVPGAPRSFEQTG